MMKRVSKITARNYCPKLMPILRGKVVKSEPKNKEQLIKELRQKSAELKNQKISVSGR